MATTNQRKTAAAEEPAAAPAAEEQTIAAPVVFEKKKKKRKKRYSRGTKDLQRIESGFSKATSRIARAASKGLDTYYRRSSKSARRRRDGAFRDYASNVARGLGDVANELSKAPYDFAKRIPTRVVWRQTRAALQVVSPLFFLR